MYTNIDSLPEQVKGLPKHAQEIWMETFNSEYKDSKDDTISAKVAWASVKRGYEKVGDSWQEKKKTFTIPDVEIFASGTWNGDVYTEQDIDEIVNSFGKTGYTPSLKIGHNEEQKISDGLPSLGNVESLKRVGSKLLASFKEVPKKVYDLIKNGAYKRVSSEIFWNYKNGKDIFPRALKAVALLGSDIPAVSTLSEIQGLYSEGGLEYRTYIYEGKEYMMEMSISDWGSIDKTKLPRSCFLIQGESDKKSTWGLPVYEGTGGIDPNTGMYKDRGKLNINGVKAAWAAVNGVHTGTVMNVPSEVRSKLEGWLKEAGVGDRNKGKETNMSLGLEEKVKELEKTLLDKETEIKKFTIESVNKETEYKKVSENMENKLKEAQKQVEELKEYNRKKENDRWVEDNSSKENFKILPKEKDLVTFILDKITGSPDKLKVYTFGDDKEVTLEKAFKKLISDRDLGGLFKEYAKAGDTERGISPSDEVDKKVRKYMKEHVETTYGEAMKIVLSSDTNLRDSYLN